MVNRGPGFLAIVRFGSLPTPNPLVSKIDRRRLGRRIKRDNLLTGEGEGVGMEPNHTKEKSMVLYRSFSTLWVWRTPSDWLRRKVRPAGLSHGSFNTFDFLSPKELLKKNHINSNGMCKTLGPGFWIWINTQ
jgi:hypothetical protein